MKFLKYIGAALVIGSMTACSIDEVYKTELDQEAVFTTESGFKGLINACYENLYFLYGKLDGNAMCEQGDIWQNGSTTGGTWGECVNNYGWSTETGVNSVLWNTLYSGVAYANTAIYYKNGLESSYSGDIDAKVAEAYFIRGFSYFHIVEQWGGVTLTTTSMAEAGAREYAYRSTEEEIYDQIIYDLSFAYNHLPASQGEESGRATKGAAAAMLCKAWLQRSRLERDFKENPDGSVWASTITDSSAVKYTAVQCADSAYKYAQAVIGDSNYSLYQSTATKSGSNQEWDGDNNKDNKEFVFREHIDHENFQNPESSNRGRTRQYYMMNISSAAENFGIQTAGLRYGRANATAVHPTLYLLSKCFDPRPQEGDRDAWGNVTDATNSTPDTRFDDTFYYKYFIAYSGFTVSEANWKAYGKDTTKYSHVEKVGRREQTVVDAKITGNIKTGGQLVGQGINYYCDAQNTNVTGEVFEMEDQESAMGCYTPNWPLDSAWCAAQPSLCAGLPCSDGTVNTGQFAYFSENGTSAKSSYYRSLSPSLKKLSPLKYVYTNQYCMNDFPIIRLTDIYLLAAEATVISGHNQTQGLEYLNTVRRHAAKSTRASEMEVDMSCLNIDFLAKERARELCAENWRYYDLKRMGLLTSDYLNSTTEPHNPYASQYLKKWYVRPIPQSLLNQIANPDEYGTNGY